MIERVVHRLNGKQAVLLVEKLDSPLSSFEMVRRNIFLRKTGEGHPKFGGLPLAVGFIGNNPDNSFYAENVNTERLFFNGPHRELKNLYRSVINPIEILGILTKEEREKLTGILSEEGYEIKERVYIGKRGEPVREPSCASFIYAKEQTPIILHADGKKNFSYVPPVAYLGGWRFDLTNMDEFSLEDEHEKLREIYKRVVD